MQPIELVYPFRGRWLVQNSPANRIPSHGSRLFGTTYSIDFVPVDPRGRSAPFTLDSLVRPELPERFIGFGQPISAPASGVVVAVHEEEPDHKSFRGLPSVAYALTQQRRAAGGWSALAGNHVVLRIATGEMVVALCHLRRGSIVVRPGQAIGAGSAIGQCGNSGNSTEPHVHVQAMETMDPSGAAGVPISFPRGLPRTGDIVEA